MIGHKKETLDVLFRHTIRLDEDTRLRWTFKRVKHSHFRILTDERVNLVLEYQEGAYGMGYGWNTVYSETCGWDEDGCTTDWSKIEHNGEYMVKQITDELDEDSKFENMVEEISAEVFDTNE